MDFFSAPSFIENSGLSLQSAVVFFDWMLMNRFMIFKAISLA